MDAYDTLSTVLVTLCRVAAPLLPFLTESIYQGLTGERSVHLTDWPALDDLPADKELVRSMDLVREVCSAAHAIRKANGLRSRLPLRMLTVAASAAELLAPYEEMIKDELNVKAVSFTDDVDTVAERVLTLVPSVLGPRLGPDTQRLIATVKRGEWRTVATGVEVGGTTLRAEDGEYELKLRPRDETNGRALPGETGVVTLDTEVDEALESEGSARDVVRQVQSARREAGLEVSDCITLKVAAPARLASAVRAHGDYVAEQTLAVRVEVTEADELSIDVSKSPCCSGLAPAHHRLSVRQSLHLVARALAVRSVVRQRGGRALRLLRLRGGRRLRRVRTGLHGGRRLRGRRRTAARALLFVPE